MKTILIPTDFSETARKAFLYAHTLFGSEAKYILANTYMEPRASAASMISLSEILHESSLEALAEETAILEKSLGADYPQVEIASEYGDAISIIPRLANVKKADLIVMGTTGASGVIQHAHCPVLAVPDSEKFGIPTNILLAADLESSLCDSSVSMLRDICALKNAKITVLNVEDPESPMSETEVAVGLDIDKVLSSVDHTFDSVKGEDVEMAISRYADLNDCDLIVTIPRKESWLTRLFNPSVSKKLAQHE